MECFFIDFDFRLKYTYEILLDVALNLINKEKVCNSVCFMFYPQHSNDFYGYGRGVEYDFEDHIVVQISFALFNIKNNP